MSLLSSSAALYHHANFANCLGSALNWSPFVSPLWAVRAGTIFKGTHHELEEQVPRFVHHSIPVQPATKLFPPVFVLLQRWPPASLDWKSRLILRTRGIPILLPSALQTQRYRSFLTHRSRPRLHIIQPDKYRMTSSQTSSVLHESPMLETYFLHRTPVMENLNHPHTKHMYKQSLQLLPASCSSMDSVRIFSRYLPLDFKFNFLSGLVFPPFWIMGIIILCSTLRPTPDWEAGKTEDEKIRLLAEMRTAEVKWAKRCIYALLTLITVIVIIVLTVVFAKRRSSTWVTAFAISPSSLRSDLDHLVHGYHPHRLIGYTIIPHHLLLYPCNNIS